MYLHYRYCNDPKLIKQYKVYILLIVITEKLLTVKVISENAKLVMHCIIAGAHEEKNSNIGGQTGKSLRVSLSRPKVV